jgi:hypothetical protein
MSNSQTKYFLFCSTNDGLRRTILTPEDIENPTIVLPEGVYERDYIGSLTQNVKWDDTPELPLDGRLMLISRINEMSLH